MIQATETEAALKKAAPPEGTTWMSVEDITPREMSLTQKDEHGGSPLT